jgi:hypothetical protein
MGPVTQEDLANVEVIMDLWIETAREKGWTTPEARGRLFYA